MPETLTSQLSDLAGYASGSASLPQAAALRTRGTRRGRQHRGGAALPCSAPARLPSASA